MRQRRFEWEGARETAAAIRSWSTEETPSVDVSEIETQVRERGDQAVLDLTARFDATDQVPQTLRVGADALADALANLASSIRAALGLAAGIVRPVAEAHVVRQPRRVDLPEGQSITLREVPVGAAGIYAPG